MKYKNMQENLKRRQATWDKMSQAEKNATTRPGSNKK